MRKFTGTVSAAAREDIGAAMICDIHAKLRSCLPPWHEVVCRHGRSPPPYKLATDLDMVMARTRSLDVLASAAATCAVVGRKNGSLSRRISGDRVQGILRAVACMGARR